MFLIPVLLYFIFVAGSRVYFACILQGRLKADDICLWRVFSDLSSGTFILFLNYMELETVLIYVVKFQTCFFIILVSKSVSERKPIFVLSCFYTSFLLCPTQCTTQTFTYH